MGLSMYIANRIYLEEKVPIYPLWSGLQGSLVDALIVVIQLSDTIPQRNNNKI